MTTMFSGVCLIPCCASSFIKDCLADATPLAASSTAAALVVGVLGAVVGGRGVAVGGRAATVSVLTALICQAEEADAAAAFVFRRYGEFWRLTFDGQTVYLKDSVGLAYIARLLNESNRDIPAVSLLAARAGIDPRLASGSSGKLLEEADREKYQNLYREYTEELEEAKRNNDLGRIERLQTQMDGLASEIARATGLGGRSREKTDADKVRKSVSMAVSRDIERVAGEHAALGRHSNAAINSGYTFRYAPEQPIDWQT
jgi:hypothetical protein